MLKHHETIRDRDALIRHPDELEHLPELPEDVVVPDDLSGLPGAARHHRPVRWLWWTAALALTAAGALVLALQVRDGGGDEYQTPAYVLEQQAIDEAIAERQAMTAATPSYVLVQRSIDEAIAERQMLDLRAASAAYFEGLERPYVPQMLAMDTVDEAVTHAIAERQYLDAVEAYTTGIAQTPVPQTLALVTEQQAIDRAVAERQYADAVTTYLEGRYPQTLSMMTVQDSIDQAVAEHEFSELPAYEQVQRLIDEAVTAR
jgi:hypothetical protein